MEDFGVSSVAGMLGLALYVLACRSTRPFSDVQYLLRTRRHGSNVVFPTKRVGQMSLRLGSLLTMSREFLR